MKFLIDDRHARRRRCQELYYDLGVLAGGRLITSIVAVCTSGGRQARRFADFRMAGHVGSSTTEPAVGLFARTRRRDLFALLIDCRPSKVRQELANSARGLHWNDSGHLQMCSLNWQLTPRCVAGVSIKLIGPLILTPKAVQGELRASSMNRRFGMVQEKSRGRRRWSRLQPAAADARLVTMSNKSAPGKMLTRRSCRNMRAHGYDFGTVLHLVVIAIGAILATKGSHIGHCDVRERVWECHTHRPLCIHYGVDHRRRQCATFRNDRRTDRGRQPGCPICRASPTTSPSTADLQDEAENAGSRQCVSSQGRQEHSNRGPSGSGKSTRLKWIFALCAG